MDITLMAEGGALRAHKVVLSACSPYFRDILKVMQISKVIKISIFGSGDVKKEI